MKKLLLSMLKASITEVVNEILLTAVIRGKITEDQKLSVINIGNELEHLIKKP
jgi:hypothetical protein